MDVCEGFDERASALRAAKVTAIADRRKRSAADGDDAVEWSGELPADSEYVIVVGGTRGNVSYMLTISVR